MATNVDTDPKSAMDLRKSSTGTTKAVNFLKRNISRFDDTVPKSFPFGYMCDAPFHNSASEEWIVNSPRPFLLRDVAQEL